MSFGNIGWKRVTIGSAAIAMDQAHPSQFGPYTLLREIARGGMGIVYEAEDLAGIRVALKLPRPELATDPRERARFVQEMRLTACLHHPNIVQVLQGGDERGCLYLAMEYVDGSTLRHEIDRRGRLPPLEVVRIAAQVTRGLAAAHQHEPAIVHRDLKPGNILLRNDGVAKVTDFGIAKAFDVGAHATTSPMGTPVYMSPEQLDGELSSPASDIHALGVILYEALTGIPPFAPTLSVARLIHAICLDVPPAVSTASGLGRAIAPELDALVADCLAKAPERRPHAALVVARLRAIEDQLVGGVPPIVPARVVAPALGGGPAGVGAPPIDTIDLVRRFERPPSRAPLLASVALVGAAGIGGGAWWWSSRESPADGVSESTAPPSTRAALVETPVECVSQTALAGVAPLQMLCIRSGSFSMGSPATDARREADETPQHTAEVGAFLIGVTEVTQAQWTAVMGDQPSNCDAGCAAELPVQNITWARALEFANGLSKREGLEPCYAATGHDATPSPGCTGYRLPTETEWEFAARAGTTTRYSFGDDDSLIAEHAWHDGGAGTHPVGTKRPNPWGLFDAHGNVWEWVADWHGDYGGSTTNASFAGPSSGVFKAFRGGSFKAKAEGPRSADRGFYKPGGSRRNLGLRIARSPRGRSFEFVAQTAADVPAAPVVPAGTPQTGCGAHALAWSGAWRFSTKATEGKWSGAPADYDVDLLATGCELSGSARKSQRGQPAGSFTVTGVVDQHGGARIDYTRDDEGVSGIWELTRDGRGTFESSAGDGSGTVKIVRR